MANQDIWTYLYNPALITVTMKEPQSASNWAVAEIRQYGTTGWGRWKWTEAGLSGWLTALQNNNLNDEAVMLTRRHVYHCFFSSSDGAGQDGVYFEIDPLGPVIPGTTINGLVTTRSTDQQVTQVTEKLLTWVIT